MGPENFIIILLILHWMAALSLAFRLNSRPPRRVESIAPGRISVIIPARNEENNLPALLKSLQDQTPLLEIIVVDDDSDDRTASLATELGATVVRPGVPPSGWRGKPWACLKGAEASSGDHLLFVDADTRVQHEGLDWICKHYPGGAWSIIPWHTTGSWRESLSAFFNMMMALGTIPDGLAGPCLIMDRETYFKTGGHELAKSKVLENVTLGREFQKRDIATATTLGRGVIHFRMYPGGVRDLIAGWTKGFATGAANTPRSTLALIACWISALIMVVVFPFIWPVMWWLYFLFAIQIGWMLRKTGSFPWLVALFFPIPLVFYLIIFSRSMGSAGKHAVWKGRRIDLS